MRESGGCRAAAVHGRGVKRHERERERGGEREGEGEGEREGEIEQEKEKCTTVKAFSVSSAGSFN